MQQVGNQSDWKDYIDEGAKYLKTAKNGFKKRKSIFTTEILYNIIAMSIEKNIMGLMLYNNYLPENHTMRDLASALNTVCIIDKKLSDDIIKMDRFQEICSIDQYHRAMPNEDDITIFLDTATRVQSFVVGKIDVLN